MRLGGGRARLGFCFLSRFLGGFGPVGIQKLAGHGQRVRGWIEARGKRRVASSSSVIGSGSWIVRAEQSWRRVGTDSQVWMPFHPASISIPGVLAWRFISHFLWRAAAAAAPPPLAAAQPLLLPAPAALLLRSARQARWRIPLLVVLTCSQREYLGIAGVRPSALFW